MKKNARNYIVCNKPCLSYDKITDVIDLSISEKVKLITMVEDGLD